jgi:sugar phosphate isomerase/epimerase
MDLESVFKLCAEEHVHYVELGYMWNKSVLELNSEETQKVHDLLSKYQLKVASIQTQILKTMAPNAALNRKGSNSMHFDYEFNVKQIDRAIEVAKDFNASNIVTYSYWRRATKVSEENWNRLIQDYESFLPKLKAANKSVVIECEPDTFVARIPDYMRIFNHFKSPHICANFDLANLLGGQKKFTKEEFQQLSPYVGYFHVKDRKKKFFGATGAVFGEGFVPWKTTLQWFAEIGFSGYLSVEPHVHGENQFEKGRLCVKNLQKLLTELKIAFD